MALDYNLAYIFLYPKNIKATLICAVEIESRLNYNEINESGTSITLFWVNLQTKARH